MASRWRLGRPPPTLPPHPSHPALTQTTRLSLRVTSHSSALYHTAAIEERIRQCLPLSMRSFLGAPQVQRLCVVLCSANLLH